MSVMSDLKIENLMELDEVLSAVDGKLAGYSYDKSFYAFTNVATDSRNVKEFSLFVPLIGEKQNGHKFIPQALENHASIIFIEEDEFNKNSNHYEKLFEEFDKVAFILVRNNLHSFQKLAGAYVEKFPSLIKVGVTGSSGKTTTKELIATLLKQKYNTVYTLGNFNSETGLPLSVFNIRKEHEAAVFEMGMNRKNEIGEISTVLKAEYAIITNIGNAHIGLLGSRDNIAEEKKKIFDYITEKGCAFIPAQDDYSSYLAKDCRGEVIFYGESVSKEHNHIEFIDDLGLDGFLFRYKGLKIKLNLAGVYNYRNALGAIAVAEKLNLSPEDIKKGIESFVAVKGRTQIELIKIGNTQVSILEDCYNANPDSMKSALEFAGGLKNVSNKIFILGDMLELGSTSQLEHYKIGKLAVSVNPSFIFFIGKEMKYAWIAACEMGFVNAIYINDYSEFAICLVSQFAVDCSEEGDLIVIKGSRGAALERIVSMISNTMPKEGL